MRHSVPSCTSQCVLTRHRSSPVQLVEKLYRLRWTQLDGLGALVISPTRELALQIFEDLRKVGDSHSLSAGLLIGGKSVTEEQQHILSARRRPHSTIAALHRASRAAAAQHAY